MTSISTARVQAFGAITFAGAGSSAIAPGAGTSGSLLLDNDAGPATLTIAAGSHRIGAPVVLDSNAVAIPAAGSQLTISGAISGAGQSLSVGGSGTGGSGTVVLGAANSYTGGTIVSAGKLILANSAAIAAGTSLTIGAGGTFIFEPSVGSTPAAAAALSPIAAAADPTAASKSFAKDLAWLRLAASSLADSGPHPRKAAAIQALEVVFAEIFESRSSIR